MHKIPLMVYVAGRDSMIVGIDIGGSTTDAVLLDGSEMRVVTIELTDPVAAAAGALGKLVSECGLRLGRWLWRHRHCSHHKINKSR